MDESGLVEARPGPQEAPLSDGQPELSDGKPGAAVGPLRWKMNAALFATTVVTVFLAGAIYEGALPNQLDALAILRALPRGYTFALPLLAILLFHEFGHYITARLHGVPASLPYFIPVPLLNPFGTMGAVIAMPERIRSRNALLDIGASGPLAGLVVAIPVLWVGLATSKLGPLEGAYAQEGQSLFYMAMKWLVLGPIREGHDVHLNATAFAGWVGLFVTALNLIPIGQLDGGHIAYALFGPAQDRIALFVHGGLLLVCGMNLLYFLPPALASGGDVGQAVSNSSFYAFWFLILAVMRRMTGVNHPPTDNAYLSPGRRAIAGLCLVLFVVLFMPTPWAMYGKID